MKISTLASGFFLFAIQSIAQTTYFSQDFSSSTNVADYEGGGANKFTDIFAGSMSGNVSTATIEAGALAFTKAGGTGTGCRFTKTEDLFATAPEVLYVQFTLTNSITEETTNSNPFNYFYFGSAITNNGLIVPVDEQFASLGFDFKLNGSFFIRTRNGGGTNPPTLTGGPFSGTQVITWIMNTGASTATYDDGQGHAGTMASGRMDVWIGAQLAFDDANVVTASVVPKQFKFLFSNGNGKITFDNLKILGGASPLPVELTYFRANAVSTSQVQINWATASERNSDYFLLERSPNLQQFTRIAQVKAAGDSHQPRTYSYFDETLSPGTHYYRLTQVDRDGKQQTYRPVSVIVGDVGVQVYPNPSTGGVFFVKGDVKPTDSIDLFSVSGHSIPLTRSYDDGLMLIPVRPLLKGLYIIRILRPDGIQSQHKLLVE